MSCRFQHKWLLLEEFKDWLKPVDDNEHCAKCSVCVKKIEIGKMGISALRSHMRAKSHTDAVALRSGKSIIHFFSSATSSSEATQSVSTDESGPGGPNSGSVSKGPSAPISDNATIDKFITKEDVLKAEAIWVIKTIMSHQSFNSNADISEVFAAMFRDSEIAKQFQCGATKTAYMTCFGLAPYFYDVLTDEIRRADCYVISFDESLNKVTQEEQMDIVVRYWKNNSVSTRYYGSQFLGHTKACDLVDNFKDGLKTLDPRKLFQISMDGPSTNWKFYEDLMEDRKCDSELPILVDLGSCGLHVVHGSLKSAVEATEWNILTILSSLWFLFKDSPARRQDFKNVTGTDTFPLKFCPTRWVEDIPVVKRAIMIWPEVIKYIDSQKKLPVYKQPSCRSFKIVMEACDDKLIIAKLDFFVSVAQVLKPFLEKFQTDSPMVPFLGAALKDILSSILGRFVKADILKKADKSAKLAKIDPCDKKNHVSSKEVDTGFDAKQKIQKLLKEKKISELQAMDFRMNCIQFLAKLADKLLERSPLKYPMVRYLQCLDPHFTVKQDSEAVKKFSSLLQQLLNNKWLTGCECDVLLTQYKQFQNKMKVEKKHEFLDFDPKQNRLDIFLSNILVQEPELEKLFEVFKMLLTLSHGQASVERGFSVNKQLLVENLQAKSCVALRTVYDAVKSTMEAYTKLEMNPALVRSLNSARMRYGLYLEEQAKIKQNLEKGQKRKVLQDQVECVAKKKARIEDEIKHLLSEADRLAKKAEDKHDFRFLAQSNACREKVKAKTEELKVVETEITALKQEHKQGD